MQRKTIVMAGGGTGGHVFPIKSLILYQQDHPDLAEQVQAIYRFGTKNSLEEESFLELQKKQKNLFFIPIVSGKFRREKTLKSGLLNLRDLFIFAWGVVLSIFKLWQIKADIIFCKGGYVALPVVIAAKILRKPILVHESDVRPGLVNRIANKFAKHRFTGFDGVFEGAEVIGQILSDEILQGESNLGSLAVDPQTQVLVMGGSQGSRDLYLGLAKILAETPALAEMHFTILLGKLNHELAEHFKDFPHVETLDFASQATIGALYYRSDLAITRAGTTALAEQELFDLKLFMVPIPWTHDQFDNAKWYVKHHGGILFDQRAEDFIPQLAAELLAHRYYKKNLQIKDRKSLIATAKKQIWKQLLI